MCQGQQQSAALGYSPMPINLVEASFNQIAKIPGADVQNINIQSCNNPTFTPAGANLLAETAPTRRPATSRARPSAPPAPAARRPRVHAGQRRLAPGGVAVGSTGGDGLAGGIRFGEHHRGGGQRGRRQGGAAAPRAAAACAGQDPAARRRGPSDAAAEADRRRPSIVAAPAGRWTRP